MRVDFATYRTTLASVRGINLDNPLTSQCSLVGEFLLQVIIGPTYRYVTVFSPDSFRGAADALQIFKHKQCPDRTRGHECLRDAVIHITHPTVFSVTYPFEAASRGRRSALLEAFPHCCVLCTFMLDTSAAVHHRLCPVICDCNLPYATVDSYDNGHVVRFRNLDSTCNGNVQETATGLIKDEPCCSKFVCRAGNDLIKRIPFGEIADPDTSVKCIDGESLWHYGPVAVPDQVALRHSEANKSQFMSVGLYRPVFGRHSPDNRLGHLRLQVKLRTKHSIQRIMQLAKSKLPVAIHIFRDIVACSGILFSHGNKRFAFRFIQNQALFERCRNRFNHTAIYGKLSKYPILHYCLTIKRNRPFPLTTEVTSIHGLFL